MASMGFTWIPNIYSVITFLLGIMANFLTDKFIFDKIAYLKVWEFKAQKLLYWVFLGCYKLRANISSLLSIIPLLKTQLHLA